MARCQSENFDQKLNTLYNHTVPLVQPDELIKEIHQGKPMVLLDTRSPGEFEVSHLKNARMVDFDHFDLQSIADIPHDAEVVVYCSVGYRSEKIGEKLQRLGYRHVRNLYGGIFAWKNGDFPVVNMHNENTDSVHTYNEAWSKWLDKGIKVY